MRQKQGVRTHWTQLQEWICFYKIWKKKAEDSFFFLLNFPKINFIIKGKQVKMGVDEGWKKISLKGEKSVFVPGVGQGIFFFAQSLVFFFFNRRKMKNGGKTWKRKTERRFPKDETKSKKRRKKKIYWTKKKSWALIIKKKKKTLIKHPNLSSFRRPCLSFSFVPSFSPLPSPPNRFPCFFSKTFLQSCETCFCLIVRLSGHLEFQRRIFRSFISSKTLNFIHYFIFIYLFINFFLSKNGVRKASFPG